MKESLYCCMCIREFSIMTVYEMCKTIYYYNVGEQYEMEQQKSQTDGEYSGVKEYK